MINNVFYKALAGLSTAGIIAIAGIQITTLRAVQMLNQQFGK